MDVKMTSFTAIRDAEVARILEQEKERQASTINLIASENHADRAVLEAQGSIMTDKYAEGYPGRRYYGGCSNIDQVETLAIERAKKLFNAEHANVQPHCGTQANMAVYAAMLQQGDTVMSMRLDHGGHLSHGLEFNFSGNWYRFIFYGVDRETEMLDYDEVEKLAVEHKPKLIIAGASAYPRTIDFEHFSHIADKVGATLLADIAHIAGMIAVGLHPSPIPYAQTVTSTTQKTLRGPRGGFILCHKELASAIDSAVFPGIQGGPLMHAIAAKAVCFFEAMQPDFATYQQSTLTNAKILASELQKCGFRIVSGGTDNHFALVDLSPKGITGLDAEKVLESANILVNRNAIPFDPSPPRIARGIRVGTPAITTRGFGTEETKCIASWISDVLSHPDDENVITSIRHKVVEMCHNFPIPAIQE
jgi:glycine hydroxymethyltransferase